MILPAFPVFCPPCASNPCLTPQLLSWIMMRSNFSSDFPSISFCKSLSVSICLFIHGLLLPLFHIRSVLTLAICPMQVLRSLFFWNFFPVDLSISSLLTNLPGERKSAQCRAGTQFKGRNKNPKVRILSTQKFTLQILLQIS